MRITPGAIGTVTIVGTPDVYSIPGNDFQAVNAVTVGNTATSVLSGASSTRTVIIKADTANSEKVFFGDSGITNPSVTEDGVPLAAGEALTLDTSADIYAISETGSQKVYLSYIAQT